MTLKAGLISAKYSYLPPHEHIANMKQNKAIILKCDIMLYNTYYNLIVCLSNKYSLGSHKRLLKILPFTKLLNGIVLKIWFHKEVYQTG